MSAVVARSAAVLLKTFSELLAPAFCDINTFTHPRRVQEEATSLARSVRARVYALLEAAAPLPPLKAFPIRGIKRQAALVFCVSYASASSYSNQANRRNYK
ncbi:unnamed protein product [Ceratitis capitata]|uniref:(Mediterranean fruit fly) hypothetical protein n=1 Tax=Ceratitis capitata TaxID=7213 RepID=A0A811VCI4_CERCA|nr:unnamed protein product [Ceratitis capitata]